MRSVSVFCFECLCGRSYETNSTQITCSCGRILVVEWHQAQASADLIEKVPATANVIGFKQLGTKPGRKQDDCPDCRIGNPCSSCHRHEWKRAYDRARYAKKMAVVA